MSHSLLIFSKYCFRNINSSLRYKSKNVLRRRPVKILNLPEDKVTPIAEIVSPRALIPSVVSENAIDFQKKEKSDIFVPPYEKLKTNDARFIQVLNTVKNRDLREKKGQMLLEGKRLINDAIEAGIELKTIYFSRDKDLSDIKLKTLENVELLKVLYKTLCVWSDCTTSPGIMGIFKKPTQETIKVMSNPVLPVTILCDNIRDPGNLGSIIRNSAAAGCQNILLMKGCVDPWETKVLRTGCGGHFRIPITNNIEWTHVSNYIPKSCTIFLADNSSDIEGSEISPGFVYYDEIEEDCEDEKKYFTRDDSNKTIKVDKTYEETDELEKFQEIALPCHLYSSIKFPKENIVLYVGGETHGVDSKAVKLACEYGGKKIKVPMENNMESLNSSFAMTIVLYEIKRQFVEKYATK